MTCVRSTIGGYEVSVLASNAETVESPINFMRMITFGRMAAEEEFARSVETKRDIRTTFGLKVDAKAGGA